MGMTRMHFQAAADQVKRWRRTENIERVMALPAVVEFLVEFFTNENPRFDADRFRAACEEKK